MNLFKGVANVRRVLALLLILGVGAALVVHLNHERTNSVPLNDKLNFEKGEGGPKQDQPAEAARFWQSRLETPDGSNPALLNLEIKDQMAKRKVGELPPVRFENFGPGNFGGRIRTIGVHPQNPDIMLVGGVNGGIWKTTDGGIHWEPKSDFLASLAIASMVVDPDQPNRVFVGTGEGFFNFDAARGVGIFVSEDFGESWNHLTSTMTGDFFYVNRMARVPGSQVLIAATRSGIFRSPDLGVSWSEAAGFATDSRGYVDLKVDPSDSNWLYAYHYGSAAAGSAVSVLVQAPESLAGTVFSARDAQFGPALSASGISGRVIQADDVLGCSALDNGSAISGNIALIDRGSCNFTDKVKNAQLAGAIAVIVANNEAGEPINMGGSDATINIPSVMVSLDDGNFIKGALDQGVDVVISKSDTAQRFVARSTDGGQSWQRLGEAEGLPTSDISRMEIAIGGDGVVYLSVSDDSANPATRGLWKSIDGGASFNKTASNTQFIERQGWYDLMIGVDPSDSNRVYMGAVDAFRSTDGGTTISQITSWSPAPGQIPHHIHADIHAIAFHPSNPSILWIGTDGGIYKSSDGGNNFETLNNDLRIAQNYGIAAHPNGEQVIAGTQDNGSHLYFGDPAIWLEWFGGDGGFCAWDQQQTEFIYGSTPSGGMFGSPNGGSSVVGINLPSTQGASFIQPFTLDPNNGNRMIVGTNRIFFSDNVRQLGGANWQDVSGSFGSSVSATTISPLQGSTAYAGTNSGNLYVNTGLGSGGQFQEVANLPDTTGAVTWIEVDPFDAQTVYVTFSGYRGDRILKTNDGGSSWVSIHGDLPEMPVFCISVDPLDRNRIYLGTELGLWVSDSNLGSGSYQWSQFDFGAAWTRIVQLRWAANDQVMWVGTHGRGTYRMTRDGVALTLSNQQVEGDGDVYLDIEETHQIVVEMVNASQTTLANATLQLTSNNADIDIMGGLRELGSLAAGATQSVAFEVTLTALTDPLTRATLTATLEAQSYSDSQSLDLTLGANPNRQQGTFEEGAEGPTLMTHSALIDVDDWRATGEQFHSGAAAWFSEDVGQYADKSLATPELLVESASASASFWIFYNLEGDAQQRWDGAVLEVEQDGIWSDLGNRVSGADYDGQLFNNISLYLRDAWSAARPTWRQAQVSLADFVGETIRLRWRLACDTAATANGPMPGFWVDDIAITDVSWELEPTPDSAACSSCSGVKGTGLPIVYSVPFATASSASSTWLGAVNHGVATATVEVFGFSDTGQVVGSWLSTMEPQNSLWSSVTDLLGQTQNLAWLQVGASHEIHLIAEFQGNGTRSAYIASKAADELYLPHVAKNTALFETYLAVVNGEALGSVTELAPAVDGLDPVQIGDTHDPYQRLLTTASSLLGADIQMTDWAVLRSSPAQISAMEYFTVLPGETQAASLGLTDQSGTELRFSHIAQDTSLFWTGMVYINVSDSVNNVTETYYSATGDILATRSLALIGQEKVTLLFDASTTSGPVPQGSAWMEVEGSGQLIGYELFGAAFGGNHDFFAGLQGSYDVGTQLVYPHVESSSSQWTGLVALNVGDQTSDLHFDLINASGVVKTSGTVAAVSPGTKSTVLAADIFAGTSIEAGDWVLGRADASEWTGFALWGDQGVDQRQNLSGVSAFVVP